MSGVAAGRPRGSHVALTVLTAFGLVVSACGGGGASPTAAPKSDAKPAEATKPAASPAAAAAALPAPVPLNTLRGTVAVDGSSTVFPVTEAMAEEFQKETSGGVRVTVGISGTGGGVHPGDLAGGRRDDDRRDRRRPEPDADAEPARADRDDDRLHRPGQPGRRAVRSIEYKTIFAVGMTLFLLTLLLNIISQWILARFRGGVPRSAVAARAAVSADPRLIRRRLFGRAFEAVCLVAICIALITLAILLVDIGRRGLSTLSWDFLTSFPSRFPQQPGSRRRWSALADRPDGADRPADPTSPPGSGSKIARRGTLSRIIEVNGGNLAGVPSIIYGLLGLGLFVRAGPGPKRPVGLADDGAAGPADRHHQHREAIRAVPSSQRGDLRLGATRSQVIWKAVLPTALPGIFTGVILALSRAIGETAPLITIGALTFIAFPAHRAHSTHSPYSRSRSSTGCRGRSLGSTRLPPRRSSCCWSCS